MSDSLCPLVENLQSNDTIISLSEEVISIPKPIDIHSDETERRLPLIQHLSKSSQKETLLDPLRNTPTDSDTDITPSEVVTSSFKTI